MKRIKMNFRAAGIAALCFPMMGMLLLPDAAQSKNGGMCTVCAAQIPEPAAMPYFTVTEVFCHVQATASLLVWAEPYEEPACCVAQVKAGTVFMVCGVTDNGWFQVRYLGQKRYISPANVVFYTGGEEETALPSLQTDGEYKVAFLGDSVTYGDKLSSQDDTYAARLAVMMHAETYDNYGMNGSCMGGLHPDRFWDRYPAMNDDANLVFVFGGTNDYEQSTPVGEMGDASTRTFYGVLNLLMSSLKQKYPDAQIVFLTPMRRLRDTWKNEEGVILEDYVNAIVNMGAFYDIPVVDLYHTQSMNFVGKRGYLADGLHPTARGHKVLAEYLYGLLWQ